MAYPNEVEENLETAIKHLAALLQFDSKSAKINTPHSKILFKKGKASEAVNPLKKAPAGKASDQKMHYSCSRLSATWPPKMPPMKLMKFRN